MAESYSRQFINSVYRNLKSGASSKPYGMFYFCDAGNVTISQISRFPARELKISFHLHLILV
jgi:hypothetical protein